MRKLLAVSGLVLVLGAGAAVSMRAGSSDEEDPGSPAMGVSGSAEVCRQETDVTLPDELRETSGLALGGSGVLWSHNDAGNDPVLYGLDGGGAVVARVVVSATAVDWEDVDGGACPEGRCLYVADTGDNDADRETVTVYRVPEPPAGAREATPVAMTGRFPDGPKDVEALFATRAGDVYLVTKGRASPIILYRSPSHGSASGSGMLERVAELAAEPSDELDRVTGASADPTGRWVALRTYRTLEIHALAAITSGRSNPVLTFDLTSLAERQGEGVALGSDGTVWLSTEGGGKREGPRLIRLSCTLPG